MMIPLDSVVKGWLPLVVTNTDDALSYAFLITLWFEPGVSRHMIFDPVTNRSLRVGNIKQLSKHLKLDLVKKFSLKPNQFTEFRFHPKKSPPEVYALGSNISFNADSVSRIYTGQ